MATWPSRGQQGPDFWDDELKTYIDTADQSNADAITAEATARASAISAAVAAETTRAEAAEGTNATAIANETARAEAAEAAMAAAIAAAGSAGPLAYAENISGINTTAPTGGTVIPGCCIMIPANSGDVWIEYGADIGVSLGGQGAGGVSIAEWTGGSFPVYPSDWALVHFDTGVAITPNGPTVRGAYHLGPTTTDRVFALGASTTQEGSSLATFTRNGGGTNQTFGHSWIAAYAR